MSLGYPIPVNFFNIGSSCSVPVLSALPGIGGFVGADSDEAFSLTVLLTDEVEGPDAEPFCPSTGPRFSFGGIDRYRGFSALSCDTVNSFKENRGYGAAINGPGAPIFQGANAIAVRDPSVHWNGTKAVFSMVVGAPSRASHGDFDPSPNRTIFNRQQPPRMRNNCFPRRVNGHRTGSAP